MLKVVYPADKVDLDAKKEWIQKVRTSSVLGRR
jgi:hypothetical protein